MFTPTTTTTIVDDAVQPSELPGATTTDAAAVAFSLQLPWADGGTIDTRFTCNGANVSPAISWIGASQNAVEVALVVTDTDADNFVHWVIAGLDPKNPSVSEGSVPVGAIEGANGFSTAAAPSVGWKGPCPPAGTTHHYRFSLYALEQQIELPTGSSAEDLVLAIDSSAIGAAQVTGVYGTP